MTVTISIRQTNTDELQAKPVKQLAGNLVLGIDWTARTYRLSTRQLGDLLTVLHTRDLDLGLEIEVSE